MGQLVAEKANLEAQLRLKEHNLMELNRKMALDLDVPLTEFGKISTLDVQDNDTKLTKVSDRTRVRLITKIAERSTIF